MPQMSDEEMMKSIMETTGPKKVTPGRVRRVTKKKDKPKGFSRAAEELASLRA